MPAPCSECPDCGEMLSPAVPIRDCVNCAGILLVQVAMADRLAQAEEQTAELPPYYWAIVEMFGNDAPRGSPPTDRESDGQRSP